jgi:hypothetical protein
MRQHQALAGFRDEELSIFDRKIDFLVQAVNPLLQEQRMTRVLSILGLPNGPVEGRGIDVDRFIEVRASRECAEFRDWLMDIDLVNDKEIADRVSGLRNRLSNCVHSGFGKSVRFALSTGVGLIPGIGTVIGGVASAIDSFLLDKVLPRSGVTTFLSSLYPSLFRG